MRFTKMHGCGNDYVYIDGWTEKPPLDDGALTRLAQAISDRHTGIGSDGLIVIGPSTVADARMVMHNSDGSRSEMCGNGIRCAAKLAYDLGHVRQPVVRIETGSGILPVTVILDHDGNCVGASVEMGAPRLKPALVPVVHPGPGPLLEVWPDGIEGRHRFLAVGMGNPHAVCFVDHPETWAVQVIGRTLERHPAFPRRTNVEFVARLADEGGLPVLRQRTWERGSGETRACGTGACAVTVAAILDQRISGREAIVRLDGGDLRVGWASDDATVVLSGPAIEVFRGDWPT